MEPWITGTLCETHIYIQIAKYLGNILKMYVHFLKQKTNYKARLHTDSMFSFCHQLKTTVSCWLYRINYFSNVVRYPTNKTNYKLYKYLRIIRLLFTIMSKYTFLPNF